jgi:Na+-driven multidrug efflux pump/anti-sigma regulatory factor (Ser/Thr protein kinase)
MYERSSTLMNRKFREYLIPTILTSAAVSLTAVVDSLIVGNLLGEAALSATGLASPIIFSLNALFFLFAVGGVTIASVARGRRDTEYANRIFTLTFVAGIAAMLVLLAVLLVFMKPITTALAQGDAELAAMTRAYLTPTVFVGPVMMLIMGMAQFVRTDGKPRIAAKIAITANVVSMSLDYIFIRYIGMGIEGAGFATVIGYVTGIFVLIPYLRSKQRAFRFVKLNLGDFKELWGIAGTGLPKAMTQGLNFARTLVLNVLIVTAMGMSGMAAMTVCVRALMIAAVFIGGANDTLLPIVGTLFGEKDYAGIRFTVRRGFLFMITACAVVTVLFLAIPGQIGQLFGIKEGLDVAAPALRMYALSLPVYGLNLMLQNFFQTTGRAKLATLMAAMSGFIFVVLFALMFAEWNGYYIWLAFVLSELATLLVVLGIGVRIRKKEKTSGILLLRGNEGDGLFADLSIPATVEAGTGLSEQAIRFCRENGVDESASVRIGIAVEEMAVNTANYGHKNDKGVIDVLVRITDEELILRLRDDGVPFNPSEHHEAEEKFAVGGIEVVRRLAKDIRYAWQLGFNVTIITIARKELKALGKR